jgi:biotin synthase
MCSCKSNRHTCGELESILGKDDLGREDLRYLIRVTDPEGSELIRERARQLTRRTFGETVFARGLLAVGNDCSRNCFYCGLRRDNQALPRYRMTKREIVSAAIAAHRRGFGALSLESGQRRDTAFVTVIAETLAEIRERTRGGLAVSLSLGEQTADTYRRWLAAGASRYLLRVETSNEELFRQTHPFDHRFDERIRCLRSLRRAGYQVGSGVIVGLPGQRLDSLVEDLLFLRTFDFDTIAIGPCLSSSQTPIGEAGESSEEMERRVRLSLRMISLARLIMPEVNILAPSALEGAAPDSAAAVRAGANVVTVQLTDPENRRRFAPFDRLRSERSLEELALAVRGAGHRLDHHLPGISPHARNRGEMLAHQPA